MKSANYDRKREIIGSVQKLSAAALTKVSSESVGTETGLISQEVTWTVEGANSDKTAIDSAGHLTVGEDETAKTLTVRAASTEDSTKSGMAVVNVIPKDGGEEEKPNPNPGEEEKPGPNPGEEESPDNKVVETTMEELLDVVADAKEGTTIRAKATTEDILPAEVLKAMAGKDITLEIILENGITWVINGKDLTAEEYKDIWLNILYGDISIGTVPASVIDGVKGALSYQVAVLKHSGEFHGKVTLRFPVGRAATGKYTNLFYYNETTGKLEYIQSDLVGEDGIAEFGLTHASQYVLYVSEKAMNQDSVTGAGTPAPESPEDNGGTTASNPKTGDEESPLAGFVLAVGALGMAAALFVNKKKLLRS